MSLAESILSNNALKRKEIEIPEWTTQKLYVQELTAGQRAQFEAAYQDNDKDALKNLRVDFVIMTLVDEKGDPVFNESHRASLQNQSAVVLDRIFVAAQAISGMLDDSVEDAEKNSLPSP